MIEERIKFEEKELKPMSVMSPEENIDLESWKF